MLRIPKNVRIPSWSSNRKSAVYIAGSSISHRCGSSIGTRALPWPSVSGTLTLADTTCPSGSVMVTSTGGRPRTSSACTSIVTNASDGAGESPSKVSSGVTWVWVNRAPR